MASGHVRKHLPTAADAIAYINATYPNPADRQTPALLTYLIGKILNVDGIHLTGYTRDDGVGVCMCRRGENPEHMAAKGPGGPRAVVVAKPLLFRVDLYGMFSVGLLPDASNGYGFLDQSDALRMSASALDEWVRKAAEARARKHKWSITW